MTFINFNQLSCGTSEIWRILLLYKYFLFHISMNWLTGCDIFLETPINIVCFFFPLHPWLFYAPIIVFLFLAVSLSTESNPIQTFLHRLVSNTIFVSEDAGLDPIFKLEFTPFHWRDRCPPLRRRRPKL